MAYGAGNLLRSLLRAGRAGDARDAEDGCEQALKDLPYLPAVMVHGHDWYFVATSREGSKTVSYNPAGSWISFMANRMLMYEWRSSGTSARSDRRGTPPSCIRWYTGYRSLRATSRIPFGHGTSMRFWAFVWRKGLAVLGKPAYDDAILKRPLYLAHSPR